jgi:formylglycine-generating enzyme required for sulfatase activity
MNVRPAALLVLPLLALPFLVRPSAFARPGFAKKEGVSCAYCHVAAAGGGERNYRGKFYGEHMNTFVGFDDAAEAKKAGVPVAAKADQKPASLVPPEPELPPVAEVDARTLPDFARWQDPVSRLWFVKIPAGSYRRGTTDAHREELKKLGLWTAQMADEMPARTVQVSRPFLLSEKEVTQAEWRRVMLTVENGRLSNPSAFKDDSKPVDSVAFPDAQLFCKTLKEKSGGKAVYRLPTEAEWEYAARAGSDGLFPIGADKQPITRERLPEFCWMNGTAKNATGAAGGRKANAWGLYDMLGNVWEWCQDSYAPDAYAILPERDPLSKNPNGTERVLRGGCWFLDARSQRPALRGGNLPTFKSQYVGLRLVREL